MNPNTRFLFGPLAAAIFVIGILSLGPMVPGYSQIHSTLSEIGEAGSPERIPFTIMLCAVAGCLLVFAYVIRELSLEVGHSVLPAYLIACAAVSAAGVGVFAHPHPLHNWFGLSELVGYQAPLATAIVWRREPKASTVVAVSWFMYALMFAAIVLNVGTLIRHGALWNLEKPVYGLVQLSLFLVWFAWCAAIGLILFAVPEPSPSVHGPD